uniref:DUF3615 domain-containing protein n=1 Tax=Arundo donax TaxID=35708 RepID=A0A0A9CV91_ARUDO
MKPAMSPKGSTFGSDTEEWHSSDSDDDPYFNSLVENFVIAAEDVRKSTLPDDNIDKKGDHQRKSDLYAESALNHYNNDKKNKIKYELISAITSWEIMDEKGCYSHVNFRAKGNQEKIQRRSFSLPSYVGTARPLYQHVCFL